MTDIASQVGAAERSLLIKAVLSHANQVHAFAGQVGRADLADALGAEAARWKDLTSTVVVAGAQKRGKSRLLNALLGRPGLLPVDADIATHVHVTVQHGPTLAATVHRHPGDAFGIDPEELADYASVLGDPERRRGVVRVDVELDHPLLAAVRLVDTPGVDSLTAGHRHVTLASLGQADALLFAVSAERQPVLREELEFLAEASQRIDTIAFAFTKAEDAEEVRALLAENRDRLARFVAGHETPERLGRLLEARWFPVSAKLAENAHTRRVAGQGDRAAALWERSGLDAVTGFLRGCGEAKEIVRAGNVLAVAGSVLETGVAAERDRRAGADGDAAVADRLAAEQARLEEVTDRQRDRRRAALEASLLTRQSSLVVRDALDRMRQVYDREVAKADLRSPQKVTGYAALLADSLEKSLEAVWLEVLAELRPWFDGELAELAGQLGIDVGQPAGTGLALPERIGAIARRDRTRDSASSFDVVRDGLPAVMGTYSLAGMAGLIGLGPVGWVVAPAAIGEMVRRRRLHERTMRARADVMRVVAEVFALATTEMSVAVEVEMSRRRGFLERAIDDHLAGQRREIEARRRELQKTAQRDAGARKQSRDDADRRLTAAAELKARTDSLRHRIRAAAR